MKPALLLAAFALATPAMAEAPLARIEIPMGGMVKYEIEAETGRLVVDRFLSMPVAYPANYGFIEGSMAGDGDPLDVLVITRAPIQPGAHIAVRPIGILRMRDAGAEDDKIIAVPADAVDPTYADVRDIADLPAAERQRIEAFFRVYKDLPEGGGPVALTGFGGADEAAAALAGARGR